MAYFGVVHVKAHSFYINAITHNHSTFSPDFSIFNLAMLWL